ncbi:MAG TPA: NADPH dehydrogenase NamA [bacterium]|nr:NADPH dehydrogenase NamA [bacterium]
MLFEPLKLRDVSFRNRIAVSPMCEYSYEDGFSNDWQLVHLGSRAVGGAGLVMAEATAVEARGRISPGDLGIYQDEHIEPLARVAKFIAEHGAVPGIQLAHAGRKASTGVPWVTEKPIGLDQGGWEPVGPSAIPFADGYQTPKALSKEEVVRTVGLFKAAAERALKAGFQVIELHAAHGYLVNEFLSPFSNRREDEYGGSFENRSRFLREIVKEVRKVWPEKFPLFVRLSATEWKDGGWTLEDSVELAKVLKKEGVDLIDCSSGGNVPGVKIQVVPGYQVPLAEKVKKEAGIATGAVGLITGAQQAEDILREGKADLVFLARQMLRDPYWPLHAAKELGVDVKWPVQYARAK